MPVTPRIIITYGKTFSREIFSYFSIDALLLYKRDSLVGNYIHNLISEGEGLRLDFKYCISDLQKIARTLSAFSNSAGGTLLIGVRDNGSLAGVSSEEELYMIDAAATLWCDPEVKINTRNHTINGKNILEVRVPKNRTVTVRAKDENGRWRAYFRQNDQNFMADRVILQVWRRGKSSRGLLIKFEENENLLLEQLRSAGRITLPEFRSLAGIRASKAEKILSNFVLCGIVTWEADEKGIFYRLKDTGSE